MVNTVILYLTLAALLFIGVDVLNIKKENKKMKEDIEKLKKQR